MTRTTLDLDPGLLEELKHLAARSQESMSRAAARLLREGLRRENEARLRPRSFTWRVATSSAPAAGFDPAGRQYLDDLERSR